MTLEKFKALPEHKQEIIIFTEGKLIEFKMEDENLCSLYSVYLFFVELRYDTVNNRMVSVTVSIGGNELNTRTDS